MSPVRVLFERAEFVSQPFTKPELLDVVKNLPTGKACGPDGFPAEFYKAFINAFAKDFLALINGLLRGEQTPKTWHSGNVVSFPKENKDREDPNA
ncbi:hypothetical protein NDU88_006979 [Pleurodeles waltl]|uniref:Reverse transcriptase n=1 Tax=Pleurodeles waltl TaxID=8319 RepID=A0AAV7QQI9_PLEWA|nr:hypothetical protein NDU88_006979 [Pleurodeles waltl]